MYCPICDQKPMNCDCTPEERRMHSEIEDLEDQIPRWVPVTERMPPEGESVLVLAQYSQQVWGSCWANHVASHRNGKWSEDVESNEVSVVTHWMPIPPDPPGVTGMIAEPADSTQTGEK